MSLPQDTANELLETLTKHYAGENPSPPDYLLQKFFAENVATEFEPLVMVLNMLSGLTGPGHWAEFQGLDTPACQVLSALKRFGKPSQKIEHQLLNLADTIRKPR